MQSKEANKANKANEGSQQQGEREQKEQGIQRETVEQTKNPSPPERKIELQDSPLLKVTLCNNVNGGRVHRVFVPQGRVVEDLVRMKLGKEKLNREKCLITVNGEMEKNLELPLKELELEDGDFVAITPTRVK